MDSNERARVDKRATESGDTSERDVDTTRDHANRATGAAGGGSGATGGISAGVGGTEVPAEEVNRQRRETPGGNASKHDDNIKTD